MPGSPPGGLGKTNPARLKVALRRGEAIKMRLAGETYPDIVVALGYRSKAAAYMDVQRGLAEYVGEPAAELRVIEVTRMDQALRRLDEMEAKVREVRDRTHITVNNGHVIKVANSDGVEEPLVDDEPVLRATAQLLAIEDRRANVQQRRAKLIGLDAPTKVSVISDEALAAALAAEQAAIEDLERAAADTASDVDGAEG